MEMKATGRVRAMLWGGGRDSEDLSLADDSRISFEDLHREFYTKIFAFVYSRVRDVELAKDLVAEVFIRAYTKHHTVRDPRARSAWLFAIARNQVAGHYRWIDRQTRVQAQVQNSLMVAGDAPDPEDSTVRNERLGHLMTLVRTLSDREQELISLKYDSELTHAEIAMIVGKSPGNVRVSIFRALRKLRHRLEAEDAASGTVLTTAAAADRSARVRPRILPDGFPSQRPAPQYTPRRERIRVDGRSAVPVGGVAST